MLNKLTNNVLYNIHTLIHLKNRVLIITLLKFAFIFLLINLYSLSYTFCMEDDNTDATIPWYEGPRDPRTIERVTFEDNNSAETSSNDSNSESNRDSFNSEEYQYFIRNFYVTDAITEGLSYDEAIDQGYFDTPERELNYNDEENRHFRAMNWLNHESRQNYELSQQIQSQNEQIQSLTNELERLQTETGDRYIPGTDPISDRIAAYHGALNEYENVTTEIREAYRILEQNHANLQRRHLQLNNDYRELLNENQELRDNQDSLNSQNRRTYSEDDSL